MTKKAIIASLLIPAALLSAQDQRTDSRLANSIAAVAEHKIITVEDVRRELKPYLPQIQADSKGEPMVFRQLLEKAEDQIIQDLTDNVLIVKKFFADKGQIPPSFIDNHIEEMIIERFEGKRSSYLSYLQEIGKTPEEHRESIRDEIIVNFMRNKMRKSATIVSPIQIEKFYNENKEAFFLEEAVHLRLIRLAKITEENEDLLKQTADEILKKLELGFAFEELAKKYSQDAKASKGGDWGWIGRNSLVKELSDVAFSLRTGEHSNLTRIGDNMFILYAEEYREEGYVPIEDVRDQIEERLVSVMAREAESKFLERLRRDSYVRRFN